MIWSAPLTKDKSCLRQALRSDPAFSLDDGKIRELIRDLNHASPTRYWMDLLATTIAGWSAFAGALLLRHAVVGLICCIVIAALAFYRALSFVHEISHQSSRILPGFEIAWNFLVGYPFLVPSFLYIGVHQNHHKVSTYGTSQDPEYLPFARHWRLTTLFVIESFFIPLGLVVRFLILAPVGLVLPRFGRWLGVHLSALTMNINYERQISAPIIRIIRHQSSTILLLWATLLCLAFAAVLPWRAFAIWFSVFGIASVLNTLRALGAHAYENSGKALDRLGQLVDSIDTPGVWWTELWAPVGLRYHALHHCFPGIPYHNLGCAYRRIMSKGSLARNYGRLSNPSLSYSLYCLFQKGLGYVLR